MGNFVTLLGFGFRSNNQNLTFDYDFILLLELKEVDTATVGGKLDYKHLDIDANHKDDSNWFDIIKRLNIEIPIVFFMSGKSLISLRPANRPGNCYNASICCVQ